MGKPHLVFLNGEWRDSPLPVEKQDMNQWYRQKIFDLEQALLRTEREKSSMAAEFESVRRQADDARRELQLMRNERGLMRMRALRTWVALGKWFGVPQPDNWNA